MAKVSDIEGIGPANETKLNAAGIKSVSALLKMCGDKKGRKSVSDTTGISEKQLLEWANMADLFRINGVGGEFSELLEAAGVDTVKELRNRNAENLHAKMVEVNAQKKLTRVVPGLSKIEDFIEQAKSLDPMISH
jgi:predicted flap endonuclease-1-like 5' DNA nuclease